jgi:hypothetical protein
MTFDRTPGAGRRRHLADPHRFPHAPRLTGSLLLIIAGCTALGGLLVAVPAQVPGMALATLVGGAWLSLVLAVTLPSRAERAGEELAARIGRFRNAVNAIGDNPTRPQLQDVLTLARSLELREHEISDELAQVRASLEALTLREQIEAGRLPVVKPSGPLPPGDDCHFMAPVRFGRRKSDQFGHLLLTTGWLKYRGTLDVSVAWSEVAEVQRAGRDLIVALQDSRRLLRFCCHEVEEAARAGVIAEHLARAAREDEPAPRAPVYHAAV